LHPCPSEEELNLYYEGFYRKEYDAPPLRERFRTDIDEARTRVRRLLPVMHPNTRLLEIGCGSGAFLDAARPYVCTSTGVELDVESRSWIESQLGNRAVKRVEDLEFDEGHFDLAVLIHVLEHVPDPVGMLRRVAQLLKPDGELALEVPNVDDVLVAKYRIPGYLSFYYQKGHLWYFSKSTLTKVLNKAGFNASVEYVQRYDLSNHMQWMLTGKPGGQGYYNDMLKPSVLEAYSDSLISNGYSDTLWAIARPIG
jgi:SAM-dependent methyltransferase